MSSFIQKVLLQTRTPVIQFQRFRGKINIQRPRQPHYERAKLIAVTNPIYPEPDKVKAESKLKELKQKVDNPYEKIIAREVINWFNHSEVVAIFHLNSITSEDMFKVQVAFHKQNMHLKIYGKSIMRHALNNTKYEVMLPLFNAKNCIVFSQEKKLNQILKITKKIPQMILIAGVAENRLLSKNELTSLAAMPDIQIVRSQLVGVLNTAAGGNLVSQLESHQNSLVNILDAHVRTNEVKPTEGDVTSQEAEVTPEKAV